jgi:DNA-binding NarL/FixJ family response regulator
VVGVIDIILVDDHPVVTEGFAAALGADAEVQVVAVAATLAEARAAIAQHVPRVAIVDIRLGDESGLDLIDAASPTDWIVISSWDLPSYIAAARRRGAAGFLLKTSTIKEILVAIKRVASGGLAFGPEILHQEAPAGHMRPLSPREREVIRLLMTGHSNDEIGREIGIARKTVESHLAHLFERYECRSRAELATRAEREGWLHLPPV